MKQEIQIALPLSKPHFRLFKWISKITGPNELGHTIAYIIKMFVNNLLFYFTYMVTYAASKYGRTVCVTTEYQSWVVPRSCKVLKGCLCRNSQ